MTIIIGITGHAGVGKDTAAKALTNFERMAFADELKKIVGVLFDLSQEQLYGSLKEVVDPRWNKSPRELLQWFGTDVMRCQFDNEFWIKKLVYKINESKSNVVVTDVRFPNEVETIKRCGGYVVEIIGRNTITLHSQHESEKKIPQKYVDYTIKNDGTIEELYKKMNVLVNELNINKL